MPYFARRICDGSYGRSEIRDRVKELYADSVAADGNGSSEFVDSVSESISDFYDFQRVTKKISSGLSIALYKMNYFV